MFRIPKTTKFLIFFYLFFNVFLSISQANEDVPLHNIVQYESPKPISSVVFEDFLGNDVNLNDYIGSLVIINFWATWCAPCKEEMPSLENLYQRFKSYNFDMLGISNDMFGERVVRPYVTAKKITFPMALDQRMVVSRQYGIVSLPTTILIDPQGIIIGVLQGAENWSDPETLLYFANLLKKN